ncbi:MAG: putative transposase [Chloroflexota bacterium]
MLLSTEGHNHYVQQLCKILTESDIIFPGTNLRLVYDMVSNPLPGGQEF